MGIGQAHGLGNQQILHIMQEATYGTLVKPAAAGTNAVKMLDIDIESKRERFNREDFRTTRSLLERITGRQMNQVSLTGYLIPSGTATTPPNLSHLITAVYGTRTIGGSDITWSLSDAQSRGSLSLSRMLSEILMETVTGFVPVTFGVKASGANPIEVSVDGFASRYITTGNTVLNGAMVSSSAMTVATAGQDAVDVDSVVKVGANTNSGAGYQVSAKNGAASTLEATLSASDAADVVPYIPAESTLGSPIAGINGSFLLDTVAAPITAFEFEVFNDDLKIDDEVFSQYVTDSIPQFRAVRGKVSIRLRKDQAIHVCKARASFATTRALAVTFGTGAGTRYLADFPTVEMEYSGLKVPRTGAATFDLAFLARASAAGNEHTLKHF